MRIFSIISLSLMLPLLQSCGEHTKTTKTAGLIEPGSAKAKLLALSNEDLFLLNKHTPTLVQKIAAPMTISIEDVIKMQEIGIGPDSMIQIIQHTKSRFSLNTSDVIRLQVEGLPFSVINYMIRT